MRFATGNLLVASGWPNETTEIIHNGRIFVVLPQVDDKYPAVSLRLNQGESYSSGYRQVSRFLSALCWAQYGDAFSIFSFSGSNRGYGQMGGFKRNAQNFMPYFANGNFRGRKIIDAQIFWFPALSYWREASWLEKYSPAYAALSYWKSIESCFPKGGKNGREDAVRSAVKELFEEESNGHTLSRFGKIENWRNIENVGKFIYDQIRCPVCHSASNEHAVDPDCWEDSQKYLIYSDFLKCISRHVLINSGTVPLPEMMWRPS